MTIITLIYLNVGDENIDWNLLPSLIETRSSRYDQA